MRMTVRAALCIRCVLHPIVVFVVIFFVADQEQRVEDDRRYPEEVRTDGGGPTGRLVSTPCRRCGGGVRAGSGGFRSGMYGFIGFFVSWCCWKEKVAAGAPLRRRAKLECTTAISYYPATEAVS